MKTKRLTALVLMFAMVVCTLAGVHAAEENVSENDYLYNADVELLTNLGMIEDPDIFEEPELGVTRIVLLKTMLSYMDLSALVTDTSESFFADVDTDSIHNPYVAAGAQLGVMNGFSDGNFYPDSIADMNQAVKVIMALFGYNEVALSKGGYPAGYLKAASETGLLDGVNVSGILTNRKLIQMLVNGLRVKVMVHEHLGENSSIVRGGEFLGEIHGIETYEGVITATNINAVIGKTETQKNRVVIDDIEFHTADDSINDYFGYSVEVYYKYEDRQNKIVAYVLSEDNELLTVSSDDILISNPSFTEYNFVYYHNDKVKQIAIEPDSVVYNGKTYPYYSKTDLAPLEGEVTFLDNDSDGKYDYTFIFDPHTTILLRNVSVEDDVINLYDIIDSACIEIPIDESKTTYSMEKDGAKTTAGELVPYDTVLVATSKNKDFTVLKASSNSVSGSISAKVESDNTVVIDGVEYQFTVSYDKLAKEERSTYINPLELGFAGIYYLNAYGKISAAKEDLSQSLLYAYVFRVGDSSTGGFSKGPYLVRMLTENNELEDCTFADRLVVNDKAMDAEEAYELLIANSSKEDLGKGTGVRQIIKYKKNDDGIITELHTTASDKLEYEGSFVPVREFDHYIGSWGRTHYHDTTSTIFQIYPDEEKSIATNAYSDKYMTTDPTYFYDRDEMLVVGAAVRYYAGAPTTGNAALGLRDFVIIRNTGKIYDKATGEERDALMGITTTGEEVNILMGEKTNDYVKSVFYSVIAGDVVVYNVDTKGELNALHKAFDSTIPDEYGCTYSEETHEGQHKSPQTAPIYNDTAETIKERYNLQWSDKSRWLTYGEIDRVVDGYAFYFVEKDANGEPICTRDKLSGGTIALLDISGKNPMITPNYSLDKVKPGDNILIWGQWDRLGDVVIVRH